MLSKEQQHVFNLVVHQGRNVFVTGGAGVGKSFVITHLVQSLRNEGKVVAVAASTGVAATLIGGSTLHLLLGMGLAKEPVEKLIAIARKSRKLCHRWRSMDVLIVDEVSMLHPDFFEKFEKLVAEMRGMPDLTFGGLQIVFVGDFFQLPPVLSRDRPTAAAAFVFETETWDRAVDDSVVLTTIFRQDNSSAFAHMLSRVRTGEHTLDDLEMIWNRMNVAPEIPEGVQATKMHSRRHEVSRINQEHLMQLDATGERTYGRTITQSPVEGLSRDAQRDWEKYVEQVNTNSQAPEEMTLRVGAQVMMLVNRPEEKLHNGSRGVVVEFSLGGLPLVRFKSGVHMMVPHTWVHHHETLGKVSLTQIPLQLAWAVTMHKSQGLSLDAAEMCLDQSVFECGQAYVALSRLRSLDGLCLTGFDPRVIRVNPRVVNFYKRMGGTDKVAVPEVATT